LRLIEYYPPAEEGGAIAAIARLALLVPLIVGVAGCGDSTGPGSRQDTPDISGTWTFAASSPQDSISWWLSRGVWPEPGSSNTNMGSCSYEPMWVKIESVRSKNRYEGVYGPGQVVCSAIGDVTAGFARDTTLSVQVDPEECGFSFWTGNYCSGPQVRMQFQDLTFDGSVEPATGPAERIGGSFTLQSASYNGISFVGRLEAVRTNLENPPTRPPLPPSCTDDTGTVAVTVIRVGSFKPVFIWSPACPMASLLVRSSEHGDVWGISTEDVTQFLDWRNPAQANLILRPIVYGEAPASATEFQAPIEGVRPGDIPAGTSEVILWRVLPAGSAAECLDRFANICVMATHQFTL
jgi:hypothetical protein